MSRESRERKGAARQAEECRESIIVDYLLLTLSVDVGTDTRTELRKFLVFLLFLVYSNKNKQLTVGIFEQ